MKRNRQSISINPKKWSTYAAAGVAAAFAGQQSAEADITLVEVGQVLVDSQPDDGQFDSPYTIDLNGAALIFSHAQTGSGGWAAIYASADPGNTFAVAGLLGPYVYVSNLPYGQNISTISDFEIANTVGTLAYRDGNGASQFVDTGGYIAFRFDVGAGTQFGWAELSLDTGAPTNIFVLERYAFADAGDSLFVGQTPPIPEPSSMACLALGAVGLLAYRRRDRD